MDTGSYFKALLGRSWLNVIDSYWHQMILSTNVTINSVESMAHTLSQPQHKHKHQQTNFLVVPKHFGSIRLCVDCGLTINKFLKTVHYLLPNIEELFASIANCTYFCVIDLSGAIHQLKLSEKSKPLLTINSHKGMFQINRLVFGVSLAPSISQNVMDQMLFGLKNVFCYLNDNLIGESTSDECYENLFLALSRLSHHNVKINISKCEFMLEYVDNLGHILSLIQSDQIQRKFKRFKKHHIQSIAVTVIFRINKLLS